MKKLVLTETDLSTITNALTGCAGACRNDAEKLDREPAPGGKHLAEALRQSADQYEALAMKIADADTIAIES